MCGEGIDVSWALRSITYRECLQSFLAVCYLLSQRYQLVWNATIKTYHEMVTHEGWLSAKKAEVPVFQDLAMQV